MDFRSDPSMHSDELKPRRTPVPTSFGDSVPRPSVPDLSIIETPPTDVGVHSQHSAAPAAQPPSSLSHLSYNDWRLKTGGAAYNGVSSSVKSPQASTSTHSSQQPYQSVGAVSGVVAQDSYKGRIENRTESITTQPAGRVVSYTDFNHRPTSAPVVRPQHKESYVGREHPLSKSAPPVRTSTQQDCNGPPEVSSGSNHRAPRMAPPSYGHHPQQVISPVSQANSNRQNMLHVQGSNPLPLVSSPRTEDFQRQNPRTSPRSTSVQSVPEPPLPSKGQIRSHVQFTRDHVPPPHHYGGHPSVDSETLHHMYHPTMKNIAPYPYGEPMYYPPPSAMVPHYLHPMPPSAIQHVTPSSQVSYDELYKLVLAQNDQLKALQAQVERLLAHDDRPAAVCPAKEEENLCVAVAKKGCKKVVSEEGTQTSDCEGREDGDKMSIGVMTSFIHAVAYRGRVGRMDTVHNFSGHESFSSNGNTPKQSKSPSSDECSSSPTSPCSKSPKSQKSCTNCCKGCSAGKQSDRQKKHKSQNRKSKHIENTANHPKISNNSTGCSEGCNCNDPGVSAAITAVRGCQAMLASKTGATAHDFSTFNGADLPAVTEQPVSPMSSIHVDLHDYRSSSSDNDPSGSQSEDNASSEDEGKDQGTGTKHNGWTFYNNVLGQVNKILEEREIGNSTPNGQKALPSHKPTDVSVSKRVAFEAQGANGHPDLKEMAIRYLKENHPEELAANVELKKSKKPRGEKLQEMTVYNMPAPNMSFATFRYLERYNLLPENFNPQQYLEAASNKHGTYQEPHAGPNFNGGRSARKPSRTPSGKSKPSPNFPQLDPCHEVRNPNPVHRPSPRKQPQLNTPTSKILDITTLRQQSKLL